MLCKFFLQNIYHIIYIIGMGENEDFNSDYRHTVAKRSIGLSSEQKRLFKMFSRVSKYARKV